MKAHNIEFLTQHAVELLKRLIRVPSYSGKEELASEIILDDLCSMEVRVLQKGNNLWTYTKKSDKPTVLLNSHLDTVLPNSNWSYDPFLAVEEDGKIFGLGSNDAGASLVCMLMAYYALGNSNLPFDLVFSATAEEEITGEKGLDSVLPLIGQLQLAIVGEPTGMKLATGERGLMVLDIISETKSAHIANFNGNHAIDIAMKDHQKLKELSCSFKKSTLGGINISVTQIHAGKQHNVAPSECNMVADIRTNELYSNEEILEIINKGLKSKVTARSTRLRASCIEENHPIVLLAKELGIECYTSPTMSDQAIIPFPSVKIGPGNSDRSHTADEFIYVNEINNGIKTYISLLSNLKF